VASRGDQKPLEWLMRQASQGIQRTVRDDEGLPKDWATKRLDLVIRERAQ
jgi:hypothetical protein